MTGYACSPYRVFESYVRIFVCLDDDDFQLVLKQNISFFITYKIPPGIYTIKAITEVVYTKRGRGGTIQNKNDDISMKANFISTRFGSAFGTLTFDEKSFFNTSLGFTPY